MYFYLDADTTISVLTKKEKDKKYILNVKITNDQMIFQSVPKVLHLLSR
jgi:hypothetical protein